ncbi:MAG: Asp23/Gls24 family envelope stress response protein [Chloroflexi bacterium]|nr:Asp23/Gls24 family envelope stress response protein [Chloroflexota bacterium]
MPDVQYTGRIEVSSRAIASIASNAVLTSYGVVGRATRDVATGIAEILNRDNKPGIIVHIDDGEIAIDVYIIVEYGTRIAAVAHSVMNVVKYSVERAIGVPVRAVNVHVEGLRISSID